MHASQPLGSLFWEKKYLWPDYYHRLGTAIRSPFTSHDTKSWTQRPLRVLEMFCLLAQTEQFATPTLVDFRNCRSTIVEVHRVFPRPWKKHGDFLWFMMIVPIFVVFIYWRSLCHHIVSPSSSSSADGLILLLLIPTAQQRRRRSTLRNTITISTADLSLLETHPTPPLEGVWMSRSRSSGSSTKSPTPLIPAPSLASAPAAPAT